jgi:hypothetical protein
MNLCPAAMLIRIPPVVSSEFGFAMSGGGVGNIDHSASLHPGRLPLVIESADGSRHIHGARVSASFRHLNVLGIPTFTCPSCDARGIPTDRARECALSRCSGCGDFPCRHDGVNNNG